MLIVHSWFEGEYQQMLNWLAWAKELGGAKKHTALFVVGNKTPAEMQAKIEEAAKEVYGTVTSIRTWYTDPRPWPVNANLAFQRAARHISENVGTPFFWCENDCIPLRSGWLDEWEHEYQECGKPFMGCVVQDPHHLTGNAIYPAHLENFSEHVLLTELVAWDVIDQPKILKQTHHSEKYHHQWFYNVPQQDANKYSAAATVFKSLDDLKIIKPGAILFHRNKDGSLIHWLRESRKIPAPVTVTISEAPKPPPPLPIPTPQPDPEPVLANEEKNGKPLPFKCSILVRTWHQDACWLIYSLQSITRFTTKFHRTLVVAPATDEEIVKPVCDNYGFEFKAVEPDPCNGYLAQQITKMKADELLPEADFILHHDSDTLFKMPTTPRDFIAPPAFAFGWRPIILMQHYKTFRGGKDTRDPVMPWQKPTETAMGTTVEFEFMRRHPLVYPRWIYRLARNHLSDLHGIPWDQWIGQQEKFSEFNFMGAYAHHFFHDKFRWIDVKKKDPGPERVRQFRSWDGMTDKALAEMKEILK